MLTINMHILSLLMLITTEKGINNLKYRYSEHILGDVICLYYICNERKETVALSQLFVAALRQKIQV